MTTTETIAPGTYRIEDNSPVEFHEAVSIWAVAAYDELVSTARRYNAVTSHKDLGERVQETAGIRTRVQLNYWLENVLDAVAERAAAEGMPPLLSLCLQQDGTIGSAYPKAPRSVDDEPGEDLELFAAEHRLLCYRRFAKNVPAGGGEATLPKTVVARRARVIAQRPPQPKLCPSCFTVLPATGDCGYC